MKDWDLVCPADSRSVQQTNGAFVCDCGEVYPIVGGVPVMVKGVVIKDQPDLGTSVVDQLLEAMHVDPLARPAIESLFRDKFVFVEDWIQTEADQFLHRVAASHEGLRGALHLEREEPVSPPPSNIAPSPMLSSIFAVKSVRPGTSFSINMRLENAGASPLSSHGPSPIMLAYHWHCSDGVTYEGHRTPLLDDLLPGRSITIPVFIVAPTKVGSYTLQVRAVHEGIAWLKQSSVEFRVEIREGPASVDDPTWTRTDKHFEYMDDHFEGIRLLTEWGEKHFSRSVRKVVELGGNASPMIDYFDAPEKYNADIDPYGMIIAKLLRKEEASPLKFVIANGMALPFAARSIDMLVMFATFHHFPDPVELLSRLSDFVADDGLICLMCEPIGHVHRDTLPDEYLCEIRKGVNEQSFALWEYQQMFDAAKLDLVAAQIDVGSAKIALRPRRG